ncbi:RNA-binding protein, putative [Plasmodium sp. DRC-Itaito]|nr:RNA-binding protein, putative [Plasmodium sp. DRC-Itaito]
MNNNENKNNEINRLTKDNTAISTTTTSTYNNNDIIADEQKQCCYYIYVNNISYGPYSIDQVIQMLNEKRINSMTFIFKNGDSNWKYLYNDDILKKYIYNNNMMDTTYLENIKSDKTENKNNEENQNDNKIHNNKDGTHTNNIEHIKINQHDNYSQNHNNHSNQMMTNQEDELERIRKREKKKRYLERKKEKIEKGLCDKKIKNSSIYITGLPNDVTKEEIYEVFKKAGIIKIDTERNEPQIKIYYDDNNNIKGDALVNYVYTQSVDMAIKYFDNFFFRQNCIIHVEKAQFNNKKKEVIKISKEDILKKKKKIKAAKMEQLRLQRGGEIYTGTKKKIVVFRNVFSYEDAMKYDEGDSFYDFIKNMVEMEIKKYVPVHKVYPIPKHPHGIVCVKFKGVEEAETIVACFNDIELNGKKLEVYFYDGKQDFKSQCLPPKNKEEYHLQNMNSNEDLNEDTKDDKHPQTLFNPNLKSFHEWIDNQSEDEEHEIMVE